MKWLQSKGSSIVFKLWVSLSCQALTGSDIWILHSWCISLCTYHQHKFGMQWTERIWERPSETPKLNLYLLFTIKADFTWPVDVVMVLRASICCASLCSGIVCCRGACTYELYFSWYKDVLFDFCMCGAKHKLRGLATYILVLLDTQTRNSMEYSYMLLTLFIDLVFSLCLIPVSNLATLCTC